MELHFFWAIIPSSDWPTGVGEIFMRSLRSKHGLHDFLKSHHLRLLLLAFSCIGSLQLSL